MFNSFDMGFGMFNVIFTITFVVVIGIFIFVAVRGISRWNKNNNSPLLTVPVLVAAKRIDVTRRGNSGYMNGSNGYYTTSSTWYYVTFQVESGDRMEFLVDGTEYGKIAEGDRGDLSFKGTRFISFVRK